MEPTQSPFARFTGIDPASTDDNIRKDFASEVLKLAETSISYSTFRRELDNELYKAGLPVSQQIARGMVFTIYSLPFGLVWKHEAVIGPDPDKSPTVTEAKAAELWPRLLPIHYGYIIHPSPKQVETNWAFRSGNGFCRIRSWRNTYSGLPPTHSRKHIWASGSAPASCF